MSSWSPLSPPLPSHIAGWEMHASMTRFLWVHCTQDQVLTLGYQALYPGNHPSSSSMIFDLWEKRFHILKPNLLLCTQTSKLVFGHDVTSRILISLALMKNFWKLYSHCPQFTLIILTRRAVLHISMTACPIEDKNISEALRSWQEGTTETSCFMSSFHTCKNRS